MNTTRPFSQALKRLRDAGLRPTRQRLALAKLLFECGEDRHVTAEALHDEASSADVRVSLATVYNTLHQFTNVGLLREVVVDSGKTYFDTNISDHHHFYIEDKGTLCDFEADRMVLSGLPNPPEGTEVERVDVIVRVRAN
ncbi:MAG TPA: Fur family transcriptional regulator [Alphaproteobacteria bacterium]|nr:Fur family transcriptional regulator [Alphaproteobacteria bacterium]